MTVLAGIGPIIAARFGVQPSDPLVVCNGCGLKKKTVAKALVRRAPFSASCATDGDQAQAGRPWPGVIDAGW